MATLSNERSLLVDCVRAFSLFGVLLVNLCYASGFEFMDASERGLLNTASWDYYLNYVVRFIFVNKSITLFSMLFGFGIATQFREYAAKHRTFASIYLRLSLLAGIGLADMYFLLWFGDILFRYALAGIAIAIIITTTSTPKTVLYIAGVLFLLYTILALLLSNGILPSTDSHALEESVFASYSNGSYLQMANLSFDFHFQLLLTGWNGLRGIMWIVCIMLLGVYAERKQLFTGVNIAKNNRLMWSSLTIGILGNLFYCFQKIVLPPEITTSTIYQPIAITLITLGIVGMAVFYLVLIARGLQSTHADYLLAVLQPMGQMALTNYLVQSILYMLLFSNVGFALVGTVGVTTLLIWAMAVYSLQLMASSWWMNHFYSGPVEWAWRSLVRGKMLTLKRPVM